MGESSTLRASVVINTYNRGHSLEATLLALRQLDPVDLEVVVVNGPSTDGTHDVLERWVDVVKIGSCPERNLSMSRNIGIALAAGDVVAFIDDDAYPDPAWLARLLDGFDDPEVAAVGGPTFDYTGASLQARYSIADRLGDAWAVTDDGAPNPTWLFSAPGKREFLYTIGTNSSFRREHLVAIGGFDEEYEYYLDETDLCVRLADRGYMIRHVDDAVVYHKFLPSAIRTPDRATRDRFSIIKNRVYFGLTHGRATHSFAEMCRSLTTFVDLSRNDIEHHVEHDNLDLEALHRFDHDVHEASTLGFEHWVEGPKTRGPAWFAGQAQAWRPFPTVASTMSSRRLHICLLSQEYPPGRVNGIGRLSQSLATAMAAEGHIVRVFTRGEHHDRVDLEDGVWVHRLVVGHHPLPDDLLDLPQFLWDHSATMHDAIRAVDARRAVDVVQAPNWDIEGLATMRSGAFLTALGVYTPMSAVERINPELLDRDVRSQLAAERWSYETADLLVASGGAVIDEVERSYGVSLHDDRLLLVANGLPDMAQRAEPAATPGGVSILYVGRLERRKGIDGLLRALPAVLDRHADARCTIVGDDSITGPDGRTIRAAFESSADGRRIGDRVTFTGRLDDDECRKLYESCDVFVAPSRFESFGLILVEAMMLAKPVVAGDCDAMRSIVEGGAGLVASADDPAELADAISSLVASPELRAEVGAAGRRRFEERYTSSAMANGVLAGYLSARRRSATRGRLR